MNTQRPLAAEGSIPNLSVAGGQDDIGIRPSGPLPVMPQRKKKPGPKRDSKPAPSEKLERNRQAQRTHRERKEQYTKDLELEVLRLKELFAQASRERDSAVVIRDEAVTERDRLREEVQRLRDFVQMSSSSNDSGYDGLSTTCDATRNSSFSTSDGFPGMTADVPLQEVAARNLFPGQRQESVWEISESRGFASDEAYQAATPVKLEQSLARQSSIVTQITTQLPPIGIDYDELGLDFVLSLERPCMGHIQYLHVRAHNFQTGENGEMMGKPMEVPDDGENQHISGHALMATAPSYSHLMNTPADRYPTQMPDVQRTDLLRLLNLSQQLEVSEVEVPPVRAWIKIMQDSRVKGLGVNDFEFLKSNLLKKVHCYRFGAVVDANDIQDTLQQVIDSKEAASMIAASPAPGSSVSASDHMKIESIDT